MATQVDVKDVEARLELLLSRAAQGEEIVITKEGKPCARLMPLDEEIPDRIPGQFKDTKFWIAEDFDQTSDEIIALFEGDETL